MHALQTLESSIAHKLIASHAHVLRAVRSASGPATWHGMEAIIVQRNHQSRGRSIHHLHNWVCSTGTLACMSAMSHEHNFSQSAAAAVARHHSGSSQSATPCAAQGTRADAPRIAAAVSRGVTYSAAGCSCHWAKSRSGGHGPGRCRAHAASRGRCRRTRARCVKPPLDIWHSHTSIQYVCISNKPTVA